MKQQPTDGLAAAELLYCFDKSNETVSNLANPSETNNLFGRPSLGNHQRDARNLAVLLATLSSGMNTYCAVFDGLQAKYGADFKRLYFNEVHRYG